MRGYLLDRLAALAWAYLKWWAQPSEELLTEIKRVEGK